MTAEALLQWLLANHDAVSARWIHGELEIRQPYQLWISRRIIKNACYRAPDDYLFVAMHDGRKDCILSPVCAIDVAAGGGSQKAARLQVRYCRLLADTVFVGRDVIEVLDTARKCHEADRLIERSFDSPEEGA